MKIYHDLAQGSREWMDVRRKNFTASELGQWAVEPVKVTLSVKQMELQLDMLAIPRKGVTKRDDLLSLLRDAGFEPEPELCDGARTAILGKIKQGRLAAMMARSFDKIGEEESIWLAREEELAAKSEKAFEYNIPVKYGKLLEPMAREFYERKTGFDVAEVGFIEHDSGGFGCSPDGLIYMLNRSYPDDPPFPSHGLEIKCLLPENHLEYLIEGGLPNEFKLQCHAGMAVSGLNRWDLLLYCPGDAPLLVTVRRNEDGDGFTDRLEAGLKTLVAEKAKMTAKLAGLWRAEFGEVTP